MLVEKLAENFKTSKVVEKVVTVVSGQTLVTFDPHHLVLHSLIFTLVVCL
jgi:hypothetical protein